MKSDKLNQQAKHGSNDKYGSKIIKSCGRENNFFLPVFKDTYKVTYKYDDSF